MRRITTLLLLLLPAFLAVPAASCTPREPRLQEVAVTPPTNGVVPEKRPLPLPPARKRNVFLITIDTLRADHLGAYGYPRNTSPNLDRFARENVLFREPLAQWPKTSPSFVSMLSGLHPQTTGLTRLCPLQIAEEMTMVAERFGSGGYHTLAVVSNPNLDAQFGFAQGFDDYSEGWKPEQEKRLTTKGKQRGPASYAQFINRHAFSALDRAGTKEGVFAWIHYTDPHAPYQPPAEYANRFVRDPWYDPTRMVDFTASNDACFGGVRPFAQLEEHRELAYYVAQYDAAIFTVDEQIGELFKGLKARNLLDDALVIITADHGEALGEHDYYFDHGALPYQDCIRVPLMMTMPGLAAPVTIAQPVGLIDLVPTMLSFAGLPADPRLEGSDLLPVIRGDAEPSDFVVMGAGYATDHQHAIRAGRWKLIYVPSETERAFMTGAEWELYDLEVDPGELHDRAAERPEIVESLRLKLLEWLATHHSDGSSAGGAIALDPRTEELLRKLGYIK